MGRFVSRPPPAPAKQKRATGEGEGEERIPREGEHPGGRGIHLRGE